MHKRLLLIILFLSVSIIGIIGSARLESQSGRPRIHAEVLNSISEDVSVIISINKTADPREVIASIPGLKIRRIFPHGFSGTIPKKMLDNIRSPLIMDIELNHKIIPFLDSSVPMINATQVWSMPGISVNGSGQTACVIDSGVDYSHPALGNCTNTTFLSGNCSKVIGGYDFYSGDTDPMDETGHGTHVAGIIASNGSLNGVAPGSRIVAIRVLGPTGGSLDNIEAGIRWCTTNSSLYNISAISLSLGTESLYSGYCDSSFISLTSAINEAVAKNISVIASTGNDASTTSMASPACIKNSTRVGAVYDTNIGSAPWAPCTDATTAADKIACFTDRNTLDMLLAPGAQINSTLWTGEGGGYGNKAGTSMAAPHVTGAILLMKQYLILENLSKTPVQIKDKLAITGKRVFDSQTGMNYSRIDVLLSVLPYINFTLNNTANNSFSGQLQVGVSSDVPLFSAWVEINNGTTSVNYTLTSTSSYNYNITLSNLSSGNYTYRVFGNDSLNGTGFSLIRSMQVDAVYPQIAIDSPQNRSYGSLPILNYTINDSNIDKCWFILNNTENLSISSCQNISSVGSEGFNVLKVYVNDTAGNINYSLVNFTVNTTMPQITLFSQQNITTNSSNIFVNFTLNNTLFYKIIWNGTDLIDDSLTCHFSSLNCSNSSFGIPLQNFSSTLANGYFGSGINVSGSANLTLTGINISQGTIMFWVRPEWNSSLQSDAYFLYASNSSTFALLYNASLKSIVLFLDNNTASVNITNWTSYEWHHIAVSWNTTNSSLYINGVLLNQSIGWPVNKTALLYVGSSPSSASNSTIDELRIYSRILSSNEIAILNKSEMTTTSLNITLTEGNYSYSIYANNSLNSARMNLTAVVDKTLPYILLYSPLNQTYNTTPSLNFSVPSDFSRCWYINSSESQAIQDCANLSAIGREGFNEITLYANDSAGNLNFTAVNFTINFPPQISIQSPQNMTYGHSNISVNFSVDDLSPDKCWYVINSTANSSLPGCSNTSIIFSENTPVNITIFANDSINNIANKAVFFYVDTIYPVLNFSNNTPNNTILDNNLTVFVGINSSESVTALLEWNYQNMSMQGSGAVWNLTVNITSAGNYAFRVFANDSANNTNITERRWVYINDTVFPSIQISLPTGTYGSSLVALSYTVSDNLAISQCWYKINSGSSVLLSACSNSSIPASAGSNTVTVYVNDTAGNTNSSSSQYTYTPPATTTTASTSGGSVGSPLTTTSTTTVPTTTSSIITTTTTVFAQVSGSGIIKSIEISKENASTSISTSINISTVNISSMQITDAMINNSYAVFSLTFNDSDKVTNASLDFDVNASWIESNNFNPDKISLYKLVNNSWLKMPTTKTGFSDSQYHYRSELHSFSIFAIAAEVQQPVTIVLTTVPLSTVPAINNIKILFGIPLIMAGAIVFSLSIEKKRHKNYLGMKLKKRHVFYLKLAGASLLLLSALLMLA